jgi:hypothetical protein
MSTIKQRDKLMCVQQAEGFVELWRGIDGGRPTRGEGGQNKIKVTVIFHKNRHDAVGGEGPKEC